MLKDVEENARKYLIDLQTLFDSVNFARVYEERKRRQHLPYMEVQVWLITSKHTVPDLQQNITVQIELVGSTVIFDLE